MTGCYCTASVFLFQIMRETFRAIGDRIDWTGVIIHLVWLMETRERHADAYISPTESAREHCMCGRESIQLLSTRRKQSTPLEHGQVRRQRVRGGQAAAEIDGALTRKMLY